MPINRELGPRPEEYYESQIKSGQVARELSEIPPEAMTDIGDAANSGPQTLTPLLQIISNDSELDEKVIRELYIARQMSLRTVAQHIGMTHNDVKRRLIGLKIPIRSKSEAFYIARKRSKLHFMEIDGLSDDGRELLADPESTVRKAVEENKFKSLLLREQIILGARYLSGVFITLEEIAREFKIRRIFATEIEGRALRKIVNLLSEDKTRLSKKKYPTKRPGMVSRWRDSVYREKVAVGKGIGELEEFKSKPEEIARRARELDLFNKITSKSKIIIALRYLSGLSMNQETLAEAFGVSKQAINEAEAHGLRGIQESIEMYRFLENPETAGLFVHLTPLQKEVVQKLYRDHASVSDVARALNRSVPGILMARHGALMRLQKLSEEKKTAQLS